MEVSDVDESLRNLRDVVRQARSHGFSATADAMAQVLSEMERGRFAPTSTRDLVLN